METSSPVPCLLVVLLLCRYIAQFVNILDNQCNDDTKCGQSDSVWNRKYENSQQLWNCFKTELGTDPFNYDMPTVIQCFSRSSKFQLKVTLIINSSKTLSKI